MMPDSIYFTVIFSKASLVMVDVIMSPQGRDPKTWLQFESHIRKIIEKIKYLSQDFP
jgi:hypothetical protein